MDLRDYPRFEVNVPVSFFGDQINGKGAITNLSAGGCAVRGDAKAQIGSFLELNVDLPAPHQKLIVEVAVVRWSIGTNFGLDFLQMDSEQEKRLSRFIKTL
jgi:c-di-GMP-binding flagellar brake protein YcgR